MAYMSIKYQMQSKVILTTIAFKVVIYHYKDQS